jgi:hypothetical protein
VYNRTVGNATFNYDLPSGSGFSSTANLACLNDGQIYILFLSLVKEGANPIVTHTVNVSISNFDFSYNNYSLTNPYIDVGNLDGVPDWNFSGTLNGISQANLSSDLANFSYYCDCTNCSDTNDICLIPFVIHSDTAGKIKIGGISVNYTYNFSVNNCTTNGTPSINFSVVNESDDTQATADIGGVFTYSRTNPLDGTVFKNFSFNHLARNNTLFCIYPNGTWVDSDIQVQYIVGSTFYDYFTQDTNLTNVTKHVNLYVVGGTSLVTFNVKDTNDNNIEGALIIIDKYEVGSHSYKTVEVLQTDEQGNTVGNIILNTAFYRFTITYNGVSYLVVGPTKVTDTELFFRIDLTAGDWWDKYAQYKGVRYNLTFTNNSKNFNFDYGDPNMIISHACLKVYRLNATGNVLIDDSCEKNSYSGNILVNIGSDFAERQYVGTAYITIEGDNFTLDVLSINFLTEWKFYDDDDHYGVFITFLIATTLVMVGIFHPVAAILLILLAVAASIAMGFYYISWPIFGALVILGGITLYKVSSAR